MRLQRLLYTCGDVFMNNRLRPAAPLNIAAPRKDPISRKTGTTAGVVAGSIRPQDYMRVPQVQQQVPMHRYDVAKRCLGRNRPRPATQDFNPSKCFTY